MKDTQGIVSSEAVCYNCRDGYVLDSRASVWKHQSHTTFKKPSNNIRIPEMSTLSNLEGDAASSSLRKPSGSGANLCIVCHEDGALMLGTGHDLFGRRSMWEVCPAHPVIP